MPNKQLVRNKINKTEGYIKELEPILKFSANEILSDIKNAGKRFSARC